MFSDIAWLREKNNGLNQEFCADIEELAVVLGFLVRGREVLILRRSADMPSFPQRWGGIHGFLDLDDPLEQTFLEIEEETGIQREKLKLLAKLAPRRYADNQRKDRCWKVHTFLFEVSNKARVKLDWENDEFLWISPLHLSRYDTMPHLGELLEAVAEKSDRRIDVA